MKIETKQGRIGAQPAEVLIVGVFEAHAPVEGLSPELDDALRAYLTDIPALKDFKGKKNQVTALYPGPQARPTRVLLVGLGDRKSFTLDTARQAAGVAARRTLDLGVAKIATSIHGLDTEGYSPGDCVQATVEGTLLGAYGYLRFKTENDAETRLESLTVLYGRKGQAGAIRDGVKTGHIVAEGVLFARDLSNAPGNALTPEDMAEAARKMAKQYNLTCKILDKKEIEETGMHALLAVNRGSVLPPRFIILEYGKPSKKQDTLVLVGKGITFDSGGISLKPGDRMEDMKHDMSGAAAVLGAMQAIGALKPPLHVVGLVPATENLPDGNALKPGDIISTLSGKTIEVINTDAEGRLVLADALAYAARYKPAAVVDLATLTGACVVALGHAATGMMGNDDTLLARVRVAGETAGERVWHLPLWEDYHDQIKSHVADVKNTGGRWGGALTAGAFLEKFVAYPWAHLDIAGTAYIEKAGPYCPQGATGVGARLLVQLIRDWSK